MTSTTAPTAVAPGGGRLGAVVAGGPASGATVCGEVMAVAAGEFVLPDEDLRPFVDRVWTWSGEPAQLPVLLPGTGAELVFQTGAPMRYRSPAGSGPLPSALLWCLRRSAWRLEAPGRVGFVAVRLRAGALAHLCGAPVGTLIDRPVPLRELWPEHSRRMVDAVAESAGLVDRAAALQVVVRELLARYGTGPSLADRAVAAIYRDPAEVTVEEVATAVGLSTRHLRRAVVRSVGVPPKEFQQLARFQRTLRAVALAARRDPLSAALDAGYYDHNHFIKHVRRLTDVTPARLIRQMSSHYYYPSAGRTYR